MSEQSVSIQVEGYDEVQASEGERLVVALERGGVDILHRCGGMARCTTCRVTFIEGEPQQMTRAERDKLAEKDLLGQARLSCQMTCTAGMVLKPIQTEQNSGLEVGKAPNAQIEPAPEWITAHKDSASPAIK